MVIDSFVAVLLDVHLQIARLSKSLSAVLTDVWFLTGMGVDVNLELERQGKQSVTIGTLELFLRLDAFSFNAFMGVKLRMNAQIARMGKGLIAQLALVRSLTGVSIGVQFQIYGRFESGIAELALESVLGSVLIGTAAFPRRTSATSFHESLRCQHSLNRTGC